MNNSPPPADLKPMAMRFVSSMWRFNREFAQQLEPLMTERHGIDPRTYFLLKTIVSGVTFPKDISEHLKIPPSLTSRYIDSLLKQDLIERRIDERDSRRVRLTLTETGQRTLQDAEQTIYGMIGERLGRLRPEQLGALLDALDALADGGTSG